MCSNFVCDQFVIQLKVHMKQLFLPQYALNWDHIEATWEELLKMLVHGTQLIYRQRVSIPGRSNNLLVYFINSSDVAFVAMICMITKNKEGETKELELVTLKAKVVSDWKNIPRVELCYY